MNDDSALPEVYIMHSITATVKKDPRDCVPPGCVPLTWANTISGGVVPILWRRTIPYNVELMAGFRAPEGWNDY